MSLPRRAAAAALAIVLAGAAAGPAPRIRLDLPLPGDLPATASFAEYRGTHLHAGLDFSTRGELGWKVRAAADGEVYRVKVERRGYGRAVYVRHAGGFETVYGHLHAFEDGVLGLERFVASERARLGDRYPGDLFVDPPRPVKRGQVIAISGEAGGGPPHLHFELRLDGEPVDPLRYGGLQPRGFAAPVLHALWVVPRGPCRVDGRWGPARIPLRRSGDAFTPAATPVVEGSCDLAVEADVPGAGTMGLGRLGLTCGGERWFHADLHRFSFSESRAAGLIYDPWRSRSAPARFVYRLRARPGLDVPDVEGAWLGEPPSGPVHCVLEAAAAAGGAARTRFELDLRPAPPLAAELPAVVAEADLYERLLLVNGEKPFDPRRLPADAAEADGVPALLFPGRNGGAMRRAGIELTIPAEALYELHPIGLAPLSSAPRTPAGLEVAHPAVRLQPDDLYLRRAAVLRAAVPEPRRSAFYRHDAVRGRWEALSKEVRPGAIEAATRVGGVFAVLRDASPPHITGVRLRAEKRLGARRLVFPVEEVGEGIEVDAFQVTLDGEPVESEYDPDHGWGQVWLGDGRAGAVRVTARCRDRAGNESASFEASVRL